ncbi:Flavoredoxin [Thermincola ferriacetica]|uniref:Flavoredoxin n=1 Tax=Thermincola ferriacetica TaxID=281456 RepID=A0A0L6VY67_9FIRM|nr:flavin reductase family protein [Thermincola ferriacetica]KNZ68277.1 Flavoredoxin [Thermincola ferriacetica]
MSKVTVKPSTVLFPVPTVMVTCGDNPPNIITIAWTGIINSVPPMVYISVQPSRHSHHLIKQTQEYVINIPSADQAKLVDYCGITSGKNVDKFKETGLTPVPASRVKAPLIRECPVNIECGVKQTINLGSHDVFIAEVLAVHFNEDVLDEQGNPNLDKIKPYGFCLRDYRVISDKIGTYGYSKK